MKKVIDLSTHHLANQSFNRIGIFRAVVYDCAISHDRNAVRQRQYFLEPM